MAGVFDRLQQEIEDKKRAAGLTALDLAELPPALRKIMRLMLRESELSYQRLREAMEAVPEKERMTPADLDRALGTLTAQSWLIRIGEGERAVYKVNLKRRRGSSLPSGIWSALDAKLKDRPK